MKGETGSRAKAKDGRGQCAAQVSKAELVVSSGITRMDACPVPIDALVK